MRRILQGKFVVGRRKLRIILPLDVFSRVEFLRRKVVALKQTATFNTRKK